MHHDLQSDVYGLYLWQNTKYQMKCQVLHRKEIMRAQLLLPNVALSEYELTFENRMLGMNAWLWWHTICNASLSLSVWLWNEWICASKTAVSLWYMVTMFQNSTLKDSISNPCFVLPTLNGLNWQDYWDTISSNIISICMYASILTIPTPLHRHYLRI